MMKARRNTQQDTPGRRERVYPRSRQTEAETTSRGRPVVLIVDDVEDNLLALQGMLRRDDIEIATANSGRAALETLLARDVALAIVDVQMPEIDGFALAELMRGVDKTRLIPIIFVTAGPRDVSRIFRGYEAGAVDFLFKPIDEQILRSKVAVFVTLFRQRQQLIQAERMREMFLGILSHDLRNPLNGISVCAQLVLRRTEEDGIRAPLERILRNSERMTRLVDQLLDFTRIRLGGDVSLTPTTADLRVVVQQVLEELVAHSKRLSLEADGDMAGTWDIDRLAQVVSNLVGNAIQHSAPATPVSIRLNGTAERVLVLEVRNSGPGIPSELRDVLFEPFCGSTRAGGFGLGLFVCKHFVLAHGGTIEFESNDASGTCFRVHLPRHSGAATLAPLALA
jgi:signal transduction histidine kinase